MKIHCFYSRNRIYYLNRIRRNILRLNPLGLKLLSQFLDILLDNYKKL